MRCGRTISILHYAHAVTVNMTRVTSAVGSSGVPRRHIQTVTTQNIQRVVTKNNRRPVVRQTETGTIQSFDWVDQTTLANREFMQPMIFKEDFRHAHAAYLKGQEISREKEIVNKHVIPAAFKAAMSSTHMELFYR